MEKNQTVESLNEGCPKGCKPMYWFKQLWIEMHGEWNPDQEVYVITWDKLEAA